MTVAVVAHDCSDATAAIAGAHRTLAASYGHTLSVITPSVEGKAAALNCAHPLLPSGIHIFLDADVVLPADAIAALVLALDVPQPRLASLAPTISEPRSRTVRRFFRVWEQLPSVRDQVIGGGLYAVNSAGRRRWGDFPAVAADDAFVRTRFSVQEQVVVRDRAFLLVPPPGARQLQQSIRRWHAGNRQLPAPLPEVMLSASPWRHARTLLGIPRTWIGIPTFCRQQLLARMTGEQDVSPFWRRSPRPQPHKCHQRPLPLVHAVVVSYDSERHIRRCLQSLLQELPPGCLSVSVIDNGSSDGTMAIVQREFGQVNLVDAGANLGFARAANRGAANRPRGSEWLLFLNPDTELEPGALRCLISIAKRFPEAGIYGAQSRDGSGIVDHSACLASPSLRQAVAYALCLHRLAPLRLLDPDHLGGWQRDSVRHVPVLTGSLLLVDSDLWTKLRGFDERFVLYGEDVDFCLRAREGLADPLFSHLSRYTHIGGASVSPAEREILILRAKAELYRRRLAPVPGWLAVRALKLGVALRAGSAGVSGSDAYAKWRTVLAAREFWSQGFRTATHHTRE